MCLLGLLSLLTACSISLNAGVFVKPAPGVIAFGAALGPGDDTVLNPTGAATRGSTVYFVATFLDLAEGEVRMTATNTANGQSQQVATEQIPAPAAFLYGDFRMPMTIEPGAYRYDVLDGVTVLASGQLTVS